MYVPEPLQSSETLPVYFVAVVRSKSLVSVKVAGRPTGLVTSVTYVAPSASRTLSYHLQKTLRAAWLKPLRSKTAVFHCDVLYLPPSVTSPYFDVLLFFGTTFSAPQ